MIPKVLTVAFVQLALFQVSHSQCINRLLSGCGPNIIPMAETLLPNPLLYPPNYLNSLDYPFEILPNIPGQLPNIIGPLPNSIGPLPGPSSFCPGILPNVLPNVIPNGLPVLPGSAVTIIEDSSVANNLANALQLMIVSNLLANTLPQNDVIYPNYPDFLPMPNVPCGFGGYNYYY